MTWLEYQFQVYKLIMINQFHVTFEQLFLLTCIIIRKDHLDHCDNGSFMIFQMSTNEIFR